MAAVLGLAVVLVAGSAGAQTQPGGPAQPGKPPCDVPLTTSPNGIEPRGVSVNSPNPLKGLDFYVDPAEPSYKDLLSYRAAGRKADEAAISKIALRPKFRWFGNFSASNAVTKWLAKAQCDQPGSVPLMVTLRHQGKQCNKHYTAGGTAEDERTKAWWRKFASDVGRARVVIGFEPDSLGTISCLAKSRQKARVALLKYGVDILSQIPNATIYLEGTASDWKSASFTASMLKRIGIAKVRGFMLNVTHYDWTANNIKYGLKVSRKLGGKPFVISTSYNGRGPIHYKVKGGKVINVYCNPQLRGVGPAPTTDTRNPKVDAFLYINRPGLSGAGGCNGAPPRAGTWWPARGIMFGTYATEWLSPPKGTRFGFAKRYSLCRLGAPVKPPKTYSKIAPSKRC